MATSTDVSNIEEGGKNDIPQTTEFGVNQKEEKSQEMESSELGVDEKLPEIHVESENKKLEAQLEQVKSDLKKKEEELKSLKDRMAESIAISLKTGGMESLNNPVSKTRLTEMYNNMKLLQWPKSKDQLKSRNSNPKDAKDLIQEICKVAFDKMKNKKQQIEEAFALTSSTNELDTQKVKEYKQLAVQNLQMALFHTSKEELLKSGFPELGGQFSEEVMEDLRPLTSECYWLSCLMALNNPPLQPDWENFVPSMDPWDIFPRNMF